MTRGLVIGSTTLLFFFFKATQWAGIVILACSPWPKEIPMQARGPSRSLFDDEIYITATQVDPSRLTDTKSIKSIEVSRLGPRSATLNLFLQSQVHPSGWRPHKCTVSLYSLDFSITQVHTGSSQSSPLLKTAQKWINISIEKQIIKKNRSSQIFSVQLRTSNSTKQYIQNFAL